MRTWLQVKFKYLLRRYKGREHEQPAQNQRPAAHDRPPRQPRGVVEVAELPHDECHRDRVQAVDVNLVHRLHRHGAGKVLARSLEDQELLLRRQRQRPTQQ